MDTDLLGSFKQWIERLFPLLIFLGIYLYRQVKQYAKARRLKQIAPLLNGRVIALPFCAPSISGSYMGISYRMSFFPPGRGTPGRMQIRIDYPGFFGLTLVPKSSSSGIEEMFSRGKILATSDDAFNNAVVARAVTEREKAMLFLESRVNREKIINLFGAGFVHVSITGKGVTTVKPGDFLTGDRLTPEQAVQDLSLACRLIL